MLIGRIRHLVAIALQVIARYTAEKDRRGLLDYDDLIDKTHSLLAGIDPSWVHYKLDLGLDHVLIDEAQDTSEKQWGIIKRLVSDFAAGAGARGLLKRTVFAVGDEKQSIYRFRGADVSVFQDMRAELGCELPLGTNFRSVPAVLDFVNALAAAILRVPPGGSPSHWTRFDPGQRLLPHRSAAGPAPAVRLVTFVDEHDQRELRAAEARELEARVLAGVVERLHAEDGIRYGDIAVLLRAPAKRMSTDLVSVTYCDVVLWP